MAESSNISRSGRVRKKSSRLADFESPDDLDVQRFRKGCDTDAKGTTNRQVSAFDEDDVELKEEDYAEIPDVDDYDLSNLNDTSEEQAREDEEDSEDDGEEGPLMIDDSRRSRKVAKKQPASHLPSSAWKPRLLFFKCQRKDLLRSNPGLDLAETNHRLAARWRNLSQVERDIWIKKARRLWEVRSRLHSLPKAASPKQQQQQQQPTSLSSPRSGQGLTSEVKRSHQSSIVTTPRNTSSRMDATYPNSGHYKVVGTDPLDAAAHLKLLGESLTVIGERLTEHEGQIAVSGSMSVLLDSLLCALCPLMCLTQQVPQLNVIPQPTLKKMLDNVAYIMPGL